MSLKSMCRGIMKEMEVKNLSGLLALKNSTITQLLISLSILSLVFSWSSLSSSYYQKLHYLSTNAMNKKYVFLIFNGILVFLANTSAIVHPPSPSNLDDMLHKTTAHGLQVEAEPEFLSDNHITLEEEDEETKPCEAEEVMKVDPEFEHSSEGAILVSSSIAESEDDEVELRDCCLFDNVDDGDGDGDGDGSGEEVDEIGKLSDDELNQKFEDFIRRMKEEFRINDHQQLVLVN